MLLSWTIVIISLCICVSNHHLYTLYAHIFNLKKETFGDDECIH